MFIRCLNFCNFVDVFEANRPSYLMSWTAHAFFNPSSLFEKVSSWWCFGDKGEGTIWLDRNQSRNRHAWLNMSCPRIELFTEVHRLHTPCTKSRPNGGCRRCLARWNEKALRCGIRRHVQRSQQIRKHTTTCALAFEAAALDILTTK